MKLVDASFLIDYASGENDVVAYLENNEQTVFGVSTIVLSELYRGLMLTKGFEAEAAKSKYTWLEPVPFTNEIAMEAAMIYVELRNSGSMINKSDIYISATARSIGVPIIVGDTDFEAVENLETIQYRDI